MTTRFDQWDSNTLIILDNGNGDLVMVWVVLAAVLRQDGDFTVKGDLMPITDGGGSKVKVCY